MWTWLKGIQRTAMLIFGTTAMGVATTTIAVKTGALNAETIIRGVFNLIFDILGNLGFEPTELQARAMTAITNIELLAAEAAKFEQVVPILTALVILGSGIATSLVIRVLRHVLGFVPTLNAG